MYMYFGEGGGDKDRVRERERQTDRKSDRQGDKQLVSEVWLL